MWLSRCFGAVLLPYAITPTSETVTEAAPAPAPLPRERHCVLRLNYAPCPNDVFPAFADGDHCVVLSVGCNRCPVHLGAGDLLLGLLGPSVLSFAVQMYR